MTRKLRATDNDDSVEATGDSFLAGTWLVASASLSGAAEENADEFGLLIRSGHESNLVVPEADCGVGMEVGFRSSRLSANAFRLAFRLPSLPNFFARVAAEVALTPVRVEILARIDAARAFPDFASDPLPVSGLLTAEPDAPDELGVAPAIPQPPVTIAAPTPKATASPPTRPMYVEALITFPPDQ